MSVFLRFDDAARGLIAQAHAEAAILGHDYLGTEHVLLALFSRPVGLAARILGRFGVGESAFREDLSRTVDGGAMPSLLSPEDEAALRAIGVDIEQVRARAEAAFGAGCLDRLEVCPRRRRRRRSLRRARRGVPTQPFTRKLKRVMERSIREARDLRDPRIIPEHIVLALLGEEDTLAVRMMRARGVDVHAMRTALLQAMRRAA